MEEKTGQSDKQRLIKGFTNCVAHGVRNRETAIEFYNGVLGFEVGEEREDWVELSAGGLRLFACFDDVQPQVFDLSVRDVEEAKNVLLDAGCEIVDLSGDETYMRDPFGLTFVLSRSDD